VLFKIDFEKAYDKVRRDFVKQVLEGKGFPDSWIKQTMSAIQGGRVCINVSGERTDYFRTFHGLRQRNPMSPILFNLVADVLASMINKASRQGKLKGMMGHLISEGITHIQYADDTILIVEGDDDSVRNMKFILYCFEWLSGPKINYHKSEAFIIGVEDQEKRRIAILLNCQLGVLAMKYLGIPTSDVKLGLGAFNGLCDKVAKRVPP
jgi:hypothetical protein